MAYFGLGFGIWLESSNNTVRGNSIEENGFGICLSFLYAGLGNNTIYHNNFVSNEEQCMLVHSKPLPHNEWNYEGEGNYWSNYVGIDLHPAYCEMARKRLALIPERLDVLVEPEPVVTEASK